jgi:hypothetical protein
MGMTTFDSFADYKLTGHLWITLVGGEYYPDILNDALALYEPVLAIFKKLLLSSESSARLFLQITEEKSPWMYIQLCRVFRKYVSPNTPVEMLKRRSQAQKIIDQFGYHFRPIQEVHDAFMQRPFPDEALCAILWEYKSRGQSGYDLTERFFALFRNQFRDFVLKGPERAGQDIQMRNIFSNYPNPKRPVDFVVYENQEENRVLAIGFARYDSDRGGAQEDDRTGGYRNCVNELLGFANKTFRV